MEAATLVFVSPATLTVLLLSASLCAAALPTLGATYYVSTEGSDENDGLSAAKPWRTLARVNAAKLEPGDAVRFRRGDVWRGWLRAKSGAEGHPIVYSAYGKGEKPTFLGSVDRSNPDDWHDEVGGVWWTGGPTPQPKVDLPLVDDAERAHRWSLYVSTDAAARGEQIAGAESPAAYRMVCERAGNAGGDIQLSVIGLRIHAGKTYRLLLRARATKPCEITTPTLMQADAPWTSYSSEPGAHTAWLGETPALVCQYYRATETSDNARITLYLGNAVAAGTTIEIDRMQFAECDASEVPETNPFSVDVGNLILGNEETCGWKVWTRADINKPGRFWYDPRTQKLYIGSDLNPAKQFGKIECALFHHMIDESGCSYVTYEDLTLKYGGAHGICGGGVSHITIRRCDIGFMGGADQFGHGRRVRFGNGIEFWGSAHDCLVEGCQIWEIYDAAVTNQNLGDPCRQENITYRNNIIWNAEFSFEYWNRPDTSVTRSIHFLNNTCIEAGHGFSHIQRPNPAGRHLCFYDSEADEADIVIKNNIFCEAAGSAFYAPGWSPVAMARLDMDGNLWYQPSGVMIWANDKPYTMDRFSEYRSDFHTEPHSVVGDPLFLNQQRHDYHLQLGSPAIGAGVDTNVETDFAGRPFRKGAHDIGAHSRHQ